VPITYLALQFPIAYDFKESTGMTESLETFFDLTEEFGPVSWGISSTQRLATASFVLYCLVWYGMVLLLCKPFTSPIVLTIFSIFLRSNQGASNPYTLLFVAKSDAPYTALSPEFFNQATTVLNELFKLPQSNFQHAIGAFVFNGTVFTYDAWNATIWMDNELGTSLRALTSRSTDTKESSPPFGECRAQQIHLELNVDPMGSEGVRWLKNARYFHSLAVI
jgi:hypothetical protein